MAKNKNYGFDPNIIEILPEDWKFGARSDKTVLQPDGQWDEYLPEFEPQASIYETSGCTVWGGENQIETYLKRVFDIEPNYSERYNYILARVTLNGSSPQKPYESFRTQGLIEDAILPYSATYDEFITPSPMSKKYLNIGQKWADEWEYNHEWITSRDKSKIKGKIIEALQYSPIAVSVTAWFNEDGVYVDHGMPNTHWCLAYGYETRADGIYIKIFDSYDHSHKILHKDHHISHAKRISITKRTKLPSLWERFLRRFNL